MSNLGTLNLKSNDNFLTFYNEKNPFHILFSMTFCHILSDITPARTFQLIKNLIKFNWNYSNACGGQIQLDYYFIVKPRLIPH